MSLRIVFVLIRIVSFQMFLDNRLVGGAQTRLLQQLSNQ